MKTLTFNRPIGYYVKFSLQLLLVLLLSMTLTSVVYANDNDDDGPRISVTVHHGAGLPFNIPAARFGEILEEISDFDVTVVSVSSSGGQRGLLFDRIDAGTIDMALVTPPNQEINGVIRLYNELINSTVPFGLTRDEFAAWYYADGGEALFQSIYDNDSKNHNVQAHIAMGFGPEWHIFVEEIPTSLRAYIKKLTDLGDEVGRVRINGLGLIVAQNVLGVDNVRVGISADLSHFDDY